MSSEGGEAVEAKGSKDPSLSYRYWVGSRGDGTNSAAAPPAQPRKISKEEAASMHRSGSQGSLWNQGGTWEERTLNDWAKSKMTELMRVSHSVHVNGTLFQLAIELESMTGDTTIVVVRNKKKHGYILDINLKFAGCCDSDTEKTLEGTAKIHEVTYGDTDGIHLEVSLDATKSGVPEYLRSEAENTLTKQLLPALQGQLELFEKELVQR